MVMHFVQQSSPLQEPKRDRETEERRYISSSYMLQVYSPKCDDIKWWWDKLSMMQLWWLLSRDGTGGDRSEDGVCVVEPVFFGRNVETRQLELYNLYLWLISRPLC